MNTEFPFRILLAIVLFSFVVHRGVQTRRHAPGNERVKEILPNSTAQKIANLLAPVALISSLIYLLVPSWIGSASFTAPLWFRIIGIGLALGGFALMDWAQRTLGKNWSDTPVKLKAHSLTTHGPYAWVRHPIYAGFLLILAAPLFISANWLVGLSWILMTWLDVNARAVAEEAMLSATFGKTFSQYKSRTGRLLPRLNR
jgi:protein-S-isoprenylcysteine O-methyltransferase Ste14